jgi:hypothetical protein
MRDVLMFMNVELGRTRDQAVIAYFEIFAWKTEENSEIVKYDV